MSLIDDLAQCVRGYVRTAKALERPGCSNIGYADAEALLARYEAGRDTGTFACPRCGQDTPHHHAT